MEENKNEEELTPEEIAKMDELLGFGGCDCSHCGHDCHSEAAEEETEDKE